MKVLKRNPGGLMQPDHDHMSGPSLPVYRTACIVGGVQPLIIEIRTVRAACLRSLPGWLAV